MNDQYFSIASRVESKIKIKGSVFIGTALPVCSEEDAEGRLADIRKQYNDATHNCYAYRIGRPENALERFSDDGEPSGTAGSPILQNITGRDLSDVLCVVTRYFGGTKLGKGGLIRAYGESTRTTLEQASPRKIIDYSPVSVRYTFELISVVQRIANQHNIEITETDYGAKEIVSVLKVRKSLAETVCKQLINDSAGKIQFTGDNAV